MKHRRWLSILLSLAILLGCTDWTPTTALPLSSQPDGISTVTPDDPVATQTDAVTPEAGEHGGKRKHVGRLRGEEKDDLNKFIYLNEDGSKTMYLYDHPVKYRDEQGQIRDISLDIADTGDKTYPFRTRANSAVTSFPASISDGITLSGNGVKLRLTAQIPSGNSALNHHARRLDDQTIAYTYDDKTTIEYALTYTGFKEDIVVSEYTGQTEYHFVLYTNGLNLTNIGGAYFLTDDAGQVQATIGDVIVFTADERNNTFGRLDAITIKDKQIYAVTIVLDADYLADPNTKYPIRIDPTVSLHYSTSGADAIEDVTIQSENVSYPDYTSTSVGLRSYGISRLLMKFNLDFSDYAGATVTDATVVLRDLMCESTTMTVYCYPYTGTAWTESTASWSALTQSWGALLDSQDMSYDIGLTKDVVHYYTFDLSTIVQQWVDGDADPEQGILFKASDTVETATTLESRTLGSYEREMYQPIFEMTYQGVISLNCATADVDEGDTLTLTATTIPTGQTVTWTSSNESFATVSDGIVTGVKTGFATITATLEDGTSVACNVWVTIPDGVYQLKNVGNGLYLDVRSGGFYEGTVIQQYSEATTFYRNQLFKITYLSQYNYYSVRPMTNSGMGISAPVTGSQENVTIESMSTIDSSNTISLMQRWIIASSGEYYTLRNGNIAGSGYLTSPTSSSIGTQIIVDSFNSEYSQWELVPYTGSVLQGVVLTESASETMCGNNFDFDAYMYSSIIGCNGPVEYDVLNTDYSVTSKAQIDQISGYLTAVATGDVVVIFDFAGSSFSWKYTLEITPAGSRGYHNITAGSTDSYNINCHGYAFGTGNKPVDWWQKEDGTWEFVAVQALISDTTSNQLLYGTEDYTGFKELLESRWLDTYFDGRWTEVYSNNNGWDIELADNQWLVVFRIGKDGSLWDYHFWYRTDMGRWANKHGSNGTGSELLSDLPSVTDSSGWALDDISRFYNSDIIYYVITEG